MMISHMWAIRCLTGTSTESQKPPVLEVETAGCGGPVPTNEVLVSVELMELNGLDTVRRSLSGKQPRETLRRVGLPVPGGPWRTRFFLRVIRLTHKAPSGGQRAQARLRPSRRRSSRNRRISR